MPFTVRAVMCQSEASYVCKQVVKLLADAKVVVINCKTGYHRAETVGKVVSSMCSHHSGMSVLHLSTCRDSMHDLGFSARVAQKWTGGAHWASFESMAEIAGKTVEELRAACITRPEAWENLHDFEESWFSLGVCVFALVLGWQSSPKLMTLAVMLVCRLQQAMINQDQSFLP